MQDRYGVKFLTYWFNEVRGSGFFLIDVPNKETAMRVHDEAHGDVATDVIEVDISALEAFLGRISDVPAGAGCVGARIDSALRVVMFTDIVDSTGDDAARRFSCAGDGARPRFHSAARVRTAAGAR